MSVMEQIAEIDSQRSTILNIAKTAFLREIFKNIQELKKLGFGNYSLYEGKKLLREGKKLVMDVGGYTSANDLGIDYLTTKIPSKEDVALGVVTHDNFVTKYEVLSRTDPIIPAAKKVIDVHTDEEIEEFVDEVNKELLARSLGTEFIDFDMGYRYLLRGMTAEEAVEDVEENL